MKAFALAVALSAAPPAQAAATKHWSKWHDHASHMRYAAQPHRRSLNAQYAMRIPLQSGSRWLSSGRGRTRGRLTALVLTW